MKPLKAIYLERRLFAALLLAAVLCAAGYFFAPFFAAGLAVLLAAGGLLLLDLFLLLRTREGVRAHRVLPERFSNGDENDVHVILSNRSGYPLRAVVLDELPVQLQVRDAEHLVKLGPGEERTLRYTVRPRQRGEYHFGALNVYAATPLGLVSRRYSFETGAMVKVYPSFLQMRAYELLAGSNRLTALGVKRVRRLGHTREFEQIRDYVAGDDPASVNWKATARRGALMVNQYGEERGQPVYCLINTGRVMKMPFHGMTLLDFSINAALVLSNMALMKGDRVGLVTFSSAIGPTLPAERKSGQIHRVLERLYNVDVGFPESDYERLVLHARRHLRQRSLLLLFTNFETRSALRRQLIYLQILARFHVLVVVFFENTELDRLLHAPAAKLEEVYTKTVAEQYKAEKLEIVEELRRHGIKALLTEPDHLTPSLVNAYLDVKARSEI